MPEGKTNKKQGINEYAYQKSIIAYLDILGFKELVRNPNLNAWFAAVFKMINTLQTEKLMMPRMKGIHTTVLSDSIIISIRYKERASFEKVLRAMYCIQQVLLRFDILLRGAIVIGDLYHNDNIVFGPALVDAYLLESTCAVYPRCIITSDTLDECMKTCFSDIGRSICKEYFPKDNDGFSYYDYIRELLEISEGDACCPESMKLLTIKNLVIKNLLEPHPIGVKAKYEWLKNYYNRSIALFCESKKLDWSQLLIK